MPVLWALAWDGTFALYILNCLLFTFVFFEVRKFDPITRLGFLAQNMLVNVLS